MGDLQGQLDVYAEGKGKNSNHACLPSELEWWKLRWQREFPEVGQACFVLPYFTQLHEILAVLEFRPAERSRG